MNLATLLLVTSVVMLVGSLVAAYLVLRSVADEWPPAGVEFDNYLAVTLVVTMVMAAVAARWGDYAAGRGDQRQSVAGFALAGLLAVAFLNGLWYLASRFGFAVASSPYATLAYALIVLQAFLTVAALAFLTVAGLRVAGGQVRPGDSELSRAASSFWSVVTLAWVVVFSTLYLLK